MTEFPFFTISHLSSTFFLSNTLQCFSKRFSVQHGQGAANWSSVTSMLVAIVDNCQKGLELFRSAACLPCFGAETEALDLVARCPNCSSKQKLGFIKRVDKG